MIRIYYIKNKEILISDEEEKLEELESENILWVDLLEGTVKEKRAVEEKFNTELFTKQEAQEIESSSKYAEDSEEISVNSNFLVIGPERELIKDPTSFILRNDSLITQRNRKLRSFKEVEKRLKTIKELDGFKIFLAIFETKIDSDADLIENLAYDISQISKNLKINKNIESDQLILISQYQDKTMVLRENIVEKQRILSSILKSSFFPKDDNELIRIMIKDVGSLLDHTSFNFERLEYLQNTFLGLVDIEQNRVIKIFTVVTVIFMPPTLIASLYGMNFHFMPELDEAWGYPAALLLMVFSSAGTLLFFKKKKWL